jgi:cytochrome c5
MKRTLFAAAVALTALISAGCQSAPDGTEGGEPETAPRGPSVLSPAAAQAALSGKVQFDPHVRPILESRCLPCHHAGGVPGIFRMEHRADVFRIGAHGMRIVPGQPEKSMLFLNPRGTHAAVKAMPPVGNRLTKDELSILGRWITQGADWPASARKLAPR